MLALVALCGVDDHTESVAPYHEAWKIVSHGRAHAYYSQRRAR